MTTPVQQLPMPSTVAGAFDVGGLPSCRICDSDTGHATSVYGQYSKRHYDVARCDRCGYVFVVEPWRDYARIYDDAYYAGEGADPLVDYRFELERPDRTVRQYEWQGIARLVGELVGGLSGRSWLDYGSGNSCLVRYLREKRAVNAVGFEEGAIAVQARSHGIPVLEESELKAAEGTFDVITAIEVLEHTYDPVHELRRMRRLLRTGGLLILTTGNVRPYVGRLDRWRYLTPEIHISFFEPRTLDMAMTAAGFRPEHRSLGRGFDEILTYKVLKNLRIRRRSLLTDILPRRPIGFAADRLTHLSAHPIGWAVPDSPLREDVGLSASPAAVGS
jgi:2-polyprenyl-3-methyl-5-hydroxy-6-metoxy-1,4-benzoquinol methylase